MESGGPGEESRKQHKHRRLRLSWVRDSIQCSRLFERFVATESTSEIVFQIGTYVSVSDDCEGAFSVDGGRKL